MEEHYFYDTVRTLRQEEEIILYKNKLTVANSEAEKVVDLLRQEYESESLNFPFIAPPFNSKAALWGARTVYFGAQLILYREKGLPELVQLFPKLDCEVTPSTILSVDLCFRFVPDLLRQLKQIDGDDPLIKVLEEHLHVWHYSGVNYSLSPDRLDVSAVFDDRCLQQLYLDRIVEYRRLPLARIESFHKQIQENFGPFTHEYWEEFNLTLLDEKY